MNHTVKLLPENVIEVIPTGNLDQVMISKIAHEILELEEELKRRKLPLLLLVDYSRLEKLEPSALEGAFITAQVLKYDKVASFGVSSVIYRMLQLIGGASEKTKIFTSRAEAMDWLLQSP